MMQIIRMTKKEIWYADKPISMRHYFSIGQYVGSAVVLLQFCLAVLMTSAVVFGFVWFFTESNMYAIGSFAVSLMVLSAVGLIQSMSLKTKFDRANLSSINIDELLLIISRVRDENKRTIFDNHTLEDLKEILEKISDKPINTINDSLRDVRALLSLDKINDRLDELAENPHSESRAIQNSILNEDVRIPQICERIFKICKDYRKAEIDDLISKSEKIIKEPCSPSNDILKLHLDETSSRHGNDDAVSMPKSKSIDSRMNRQSSNKIQ